MAKMIIDVPEDIRKAFRIVCLQNESTMKDEIVKLMKEYIKKGGMPKGKK